MPNYRRAFHPGGIFSFTLVTFERRPLFVNPAHVDLLRSTMAAARAELPFTALAGIVLPDHVHLLWELPDGYHGYSRRVGRMKALFTKSLRLRTAGSARPTTAALSRRREADVWQLRFWEHLIRDQDDFNQHLDYIHYNPVKHGLVTCPHAHSASSFKRWVQSGAYEPDWQCVCGGTTKPPPASDRLNGLSME